MQATTNHSYLIGRVTIAAVFLSAAYLLAQEPTYPGTAKVIYSFARSRGSPAPEGCVPRGGLVLGDDGNFYGATSVCGAAEWGTIFRITPNGALTTLHSFKNRDDGGMPIGSLVKDKDGIFYGVNEMGIAFRITSEGKFTVFGKLGNNNPNGLMLASDGNLYAITVGGFFRIDRTTGAITQISMTGASVGAPPPQSLGRWPLVEAADGNLYGASENAVHRLSKTGEGLLLLCSGQVRCPDGGHFEPNLRFGAGLALGADGNLYGSTYDGVVRITPSGVFTRLLFYADVSLFASGPARLLRGTDGNFYGFNELGTIYQVTPTGSLRLIYRLDPTVRGHEAEGVSGGFTLAEGPDGLYGTTSVGGAGFGGGGTIFKITCPFCGSDAARQAPPPPAETLCRGAVCPIEAVDPKGDPGDDKQTLLSSFLHWDRTSYEAFATFPKTVNGLAADGVTPVILRWRLPKAGQVTFYIRDDEKSGMLGCVYSPSCARGDTTSYSADVQQLSDGNYAFVRLMAPLDFARSGTAGDLTTGVRAVNIVATLTPDDGPPVTQSTVLYLIRPPVVLLHGIWSNYETWDDWHMDTDERFIVWVQDYEATNAAPFVDNLGLNTAKGRNQPLAGIGAALAFARAKGFAATQVDFIGHSMGGLLARLYAGQYRGIEYYRDENLGAGDIHKLITLDTPHWGSELANCLVDDNNQLTVYGKIWQNLPHSGCANCGAAFDLRVGSDVLRNLPEVKVPAHAMVGVGGDTGVSDLDRLTSAVGDLSSIKPNQVVLVLKGLLALIDGLADFTTSVFGNQRHDLIVSAPSQVGGISANATSFFDMHLPFELAVHMTVTGEAQTYFKVVELLNAPVAGPLFSFFPSGAAAGRRTTQCNIPENLP